MTIFKFKSFIIFELLADFKKAHYTIIFFLTRQKTEKCSCMPATIPFVQKVKPHLQRFFNCGVTTSSLLLIPEVFRFCEWQWCRQEKKLGGRNDVITCDFVELQKNMNKTIGILAFRRCSLIGIPKVGYCTSSVIFFHFCNYIVTHNPNGIIG